MKILLSYVHYPLSVAKFFKAAFKTLGHEVWSAGPCAYGQIPWQPATDFSAYADIPDLELFPGEHGLVHSYPIEPVLEACPWTPSLIVQIDAGFHLKGGYVRTPIVLVGTDPHCLDYHSQSEYANVFFIMQEYYAKDYLDVAGKVGGGPVPLWLPYCYDPEVHYWDPLAEKEYDVCFIGVMYPERRALLGQIAASGVKTFSAQGILFEEGTAYYNRSRIALNLSSREDLPMRWWEGLAYRNCVVTNRVPDLDELAGQDCREGEHYLAYDTPEECVEVIQKVLAEPRRLNQIADAGYVWVQQKTYARRAQTIIEAVFGEEVPS